MDPCVGRAASARFNARHAKPHVPRRSIDRWWRRLLVINARENRRGIRASEGDADDEEGHDPTRLSLTKLPTTLRFPSSLGMD